MLLLSTSKPPTEIVKSPIEFEEFLDTYPDGEELANVARQIANLGGPFSSRDASGLFLDFVQRCRYNLSLTLPFFFKYPKDKPMTLREHTPFYPLFQLGALRNMVIIGGRQIAKSSSMAARHILKMQIFPAYNITYLTPRFEQAKIFGARFRQLWATYAYREAMAAPDSPNALQYKEFNNQSTHMITYALTNVDRTRGRSTDDLDLDEVQDLDSNYLVPLLETMQASDWKNVTYSGTAKSVDTTLETLWQESSMAERVIPCDGCTLDNIPTIENKVMDMIQPAGLSCVKCGKLLDLEKARWRHQFEDRIEDYPGYHIPQIIIPKFVNDLIQWRSIYNKKVKWDYHDFISECLGISTDTGMREISEFDLQGACTLGDRAEEFKKKAARGDYRFVISGMDWGGSDYKPMSKTKKSYTVHSILGVHSPEDVDVIYAKRYAGMDYESIVGDVLHHHKDFGGTHLASDFGVGQTYNWLLRKKIHISCHYIFNYASGKMNHYIQIPKDMPMENQISLNRDESISFLYMAVKKKWTHFYRWEVIQEYLKEFLALYRAPVESSTGERSWAYLKQGDKCDDFLHSVNFAYTAGRLLCGEITLHDPNIEDIQAQLPKRSSLAPEMSIEELLDH